MLNKNKNLKLYYSIGEVAQMFNVAESLLRYWEGEFPTIKPKKVGKGVRQYSKDDIEAIRLVYHLVKEQGMTLSGAREVIHHSKDGTTSRLEIITRLESVRDQLQSLNKALNELV
ncbi:MAG: MerR family transcriptional regulator [Bacteroidaceae bacterium]|nr:MerR family transcriptional regulator [Bacteroidaceae bacterium]